MGGESGNRLAKMILERNADSFNGFALHPISQLSVSEAGIAFIRREENTVRDPNDSTKHVLYDDPKKNCTIGYGTLVHLGPCNGTHIEEQKYLNGIGDSEAERLLRIRVEQAENDVQTIMSGSHLTQPMYDAYVSLLYNLGRPNAKITWRVFEDARQGKYREAAKEFLDIDNATSEDQVRTKLPGLTRRRKRESELFLNGTY